MAMFRSPAELQQIELQKIKEEYDKKLQAVGGHPELLIPSKELWRLFVEGKAQQKGKGIESYFEKHAPDIYKNRAYDISIEWFARLVGRAEKCKWRDCSFMTFLERKFWKLTDAQCKMKIKDFLLLDQAWLQYENERGYTEALRLVHEEIFDFNVPLNADFVMKLHGDAVARVDGTAYTKKQADAYFFRNSIACQMLLYPENCSQRGVVEFLKRNAVKQSSPPDCDFIFIMTIYDPNEYELGYIFLNNQSIGLLRDFAALKGFEPPADEPKKVAAWRTFVGASCCATQQNEKEFFHYLTNSPDLFDFLEKIGATKTEDEFAECLLSEVKTKDGDWVDDYGFSYDFALESLQIGGRVKPREALIQEVNKYFAQYQEDIQKAGANFRAILLTIVTLIQSLHQLHPFADGNGRTFCILLLDHLLMRNGLPPSIMFDTAVFSCYSHEELVERVIEGMQNTMQLLNKENIYGVDTDAVLSSIATSQDLSEYKKAFEEGVAQEDARRKTKFSSTPSQPAAPL